MNPPDTIEWEGGRFTRSYWALPVAGAVAHYREDVPTSSRHIVLLEDGTYRLLHADSYNPQYGPFHAIAHLWRDTPYAPIVAVAGLLTLNYLWPSRR